MADNQLRGTEVQDCPAIRVTQNEGCPSIRVRITGGGETPEAPLSDVNFYDYDGKRVASYTAADFAALDAMPANPSHQGLTAQGWNWSLADAQAAVAANGRLDVGQNYTTDDGKTRLYIEIAEPERMTVTVYWRQLVSESITINWGDESAEETAPGTNAVNLSHTYARVGNYKITMKSNGSQYSLGSGTASYAVIGPTSNTGRYETNRLLRVEIGDYISDLPYSCFSQCASLSSVSIPQAVKLFNASCFSNCHTLKGVILPSGSTMLDGYALNVCESLAVVVFPKTNIAALNDNNFSSDMSLRSIVLPSSLTQIKNNVFNACSSLTSITIPAGVTSIGNAAFSNCYGMKAYHFKSTTPATLGTTVFNNIPADCKIYVPNSAVATYQGATGWIDYASYIVGE